MNEAVNEVRKSEHRRLQAQGDDILKSTRQLWRNRPATPCGVRDATRS
jgi:hypothetical protein